MFRLPKAIFTQLKFQISEAGNSQRWQGNFSVVVFDKQNWSKLCKIQGFFQL